MCLSRVNASDAATRSKVSGRANGSVPVAKVRARGVMARRLDRHRQAAAVDKLQAVSRQPVLGSSEPLI